MKEYGEGKEWRKGYKGKKKGRLGESMKVRKDD
jgi:hypothetical protein